MWVLGTWVKFFFVFFFQAEDGIRDLTVTGVQTCALPISALPNLELIRVECLIMIESLSRWDHRFRQSLGWEGRLAPAQVPKRSEERRVGKECRSRWWPYHEKKKTQQPTSHRSSDDRFPAA